MSLPPRDTKYMIRAMACLITLAAIGMWYPLSHREIVVGFGLLGMVLVAANIWVCKIPIFPYDRILSAVSDNEGLDWTREEGVRIDVGGIHDSCQVYYPKVVHLDEGYRLYYRAGGNNAHIASAFSTDGLSWREELGVRIGPPVERGWQRIEGCDVLGSVDAGWAMYFSASDGQCWRLYRSESVDGLEWTDGRLCFDTGEDEAWPHCKAPAIVRVAAGMRMYFMRFSADDLEIATSFSSDGRQWEPAESCSGLSPDTKIIRNPCVRPAPDGKLRMYFIERTTDNRPVGGRVISAVSEDGVDWCREAGVRLGPGRVWDRHGIFSVDPLAVSGGWRIYYSGYWGRHLLEPLTLWKYRRSGG